MQHASSNPQVFETQTARALYLLCDIATLVAVLFVAVLTLILYLPIQLLHYSRQCLTLHHTGARS